MSRSKRPKSSSSSMASSRPCGSDRWGRKISPSSRAFATSRSEEHTSELQSQSNLVCRLLLEKKKKYKPEHKTIGQSLTPNLSLRYLSPDLKYSNIQICVPYTGCVPCISIASSARSYVPYMHA